MKAIITWYNKADQLVQEAGAIQKDIAAQILSLPTREAQMDFVASKVARIVQQGRRREGFDGAICTSLLVRSYHFVCTKRLCREEGPSPSQD